MKLFLMFFLLASTGYAADDNGVIVTESQHNFQMTVSKIEAAIKEKGLSVFAVIDHAKNAVNAGLTLAPNTVFIFGNPKIGTPIMEGSAAAGLDFPVKIQVYTSGEKIKVAYNDPAYIAKRHGVDAGLPQLKKMAGALDGIVKGATK